MIVSEPSKVSWSFFTNIRIGSFIKALVTSITSAGIVAERRIICTPKRSIEVANKYLYTFIKKTYINELSLLK
jgi:hypothetical protein